MIVSQQLLAWPQVWPHLRMIALQEVERAALHSNQ